MIGWRALLAVLEIRLRVMLANMNSNFWRAFWLMMNLVRAPIGWWVWFSELSFGWWVWLSELLFLDEFDCLNSHWLMSFIVWTHIGLWVWLSALLLADEFDSLNSLWLTSLIGWTPFWMMSLIVWTPIGWWETVYLLMNEVLVIPSCLLVATLHPRVRFRPLFIKSQFTHVYAVVSHHRNTRLST